MLKNAFYFIAGSVTTIALSYVIVEIDQRMKAKNNLKLVHPN